MSNCEARIFAVSPDEDICITGVSGQFPSSHNVAEFEENLYNKVDMINDHCGRWPHYHSEIPKRMGTIYDIDRFDAQFFGINRKQAEIMDPQGRLLLERAYEAITDAGVNPKALRGSRTAVYIGACFAESEKTWFYDRLSERGYGITGCSRAMLANRISYSLGLEGPSFLLDTACSSSMYALDAAFSAMRSGQCDAAIVGGANLLLNPNTSIQFARLGVLAADGFCRPFDAAASGYVRAEAISTVFLQKARDARRIYARVVYSKTNCDGFKQHGITYPSGRVQQKLLSEFYADLRMNPAHVGYVEAHSTGTVVGDPEECIALDAVFCRGRSSAAPLLVGSVKSNIGHSESTSGVCSIVKVVLGLERGAMAPNINFTEIRGEIAALREQRMRVCTEVTPLAADALVGINSFGFGGANAHALLHGHDKPKRNGGAPLDDVPRLVQWAGRTEESISAMMEFLTSRPLDAEYVALLQGIQSVEEPGFVHRGYGLLARAAQREGAAVCLASDSQRFDGVRRPFVWIFSGMGSQWPQMGRSLLSVPLFRQSIDRSCATLRKHGVDVMECLTSPDATLLDDIVCSFVGIAAVQIGLVDVLHALDMRPDYMIGHSVGELGCGYADGALTAEQMLLAAYWRGVSSKEARLERGAMAAVGLGYRAIVGMLPADIEVACHNSAESCTISGPEASVATFVQQLGDMNVFARTVNSSHIAYHSRYVRDIGPRLLANSADLAIGSVRRSERWLSTSVPRSRWHEPQAQHSSPQYYVNNLLNPVLFEEAMALLPDNSITIEIAPHGLLQSIVKKSMPFAVHVPLTLRSAPDNAVHFLTALGRLYLNGITMPLERIYPAIEYPVSRGTAKIASLLRWEHSDSYFVTNFDVTKPPESGEQRLKISLAENEYAYVAGHNIDGRCLFPATGYLELVWITFARMRGIVHHLLNVEFEDVQFLRATALQPHADIELTVMVHYGNGTFEVSEGTTSIVTGIVRIIDAAEQPIQLPPPGHAPYPELDRDEFYKELRLRGYQYRDAFQSVERARSDGLFGRIRWHMNWVSFMDCMLQIGILSQDTRSLLLPTRIQRVRIFAVEHMACVRRGVASETADGLAGVEQQQQLMCDVHMNRELNVIQAGGVEIHGMVTNVVARRKMAGDLVLEAYRFVPLAVASDAPLERADAVRVCLQLVLENLPLLTVLRVVEVLAGRMTDVKPLLFVVDDALGEMPIITGRLMLLTERTVDTQHHHIDVLSGEMREQGECELLIVGDWQVDGEFWMDAQNMLTDGGFVIVRVPNVDEGNQEVPEGFNVISRIATTDAESLVLLRKITTNSPSEAPLVIDISHGTETFEWLDELKAAVSKSRVLLLAQHDQHSGIVALVNCLRREPDTRSIACVFIADEHAPPFSANASFYREQLDLDLAVNVFKHGVWGSFRHVKLAQPKQLQPRRSHYYANVLRNGDLSSFAWLQGPLQPDAADLVRVQYASINFRDVMLATGRLSAEIFDMQRVNRECVLGLEFAGNAVADGRRVMGMVTSGAMATLVRPFEPLTWTVPDRWSLREAATVPVVYVTVYCAFFLGKRIEAGKSILIHAGSGGVGLAAIRVALAYGMEVFTTVSNAQKKRYVLEMFPELKETNIGNSRDCSFEHLIKLRTHGRGVDFVLNSLSDEKLHASVRCLGRAGVFLEIGKFDLSNDTKLGLGVFLKELSFRSVLADNLFVPGGTAETRHIHALIERDLGAGIIRPLEATVFQVDEIEKAYRYLSNGQHVGKVMIRVRSDELAERTVPIATLPRMYFDAERVYVVAGGLGGFGLELTDWLVLRGARRVLLSSSRGISTKYQVYRMRIWQNYGCNIHVSTADITTAAGCRDLLTQAGHLGAIAGIFNLAGCLRDALLVNQTGDSFRQCLAPKATATAHLDAAARAMCPRLAHFVCFSSLASGRGNAGQSNYGMANGCMERIVEQRCADGLAGKAIQWGAIGEVGMAAQLMATAATDGEPEIAGTLMQRIGSCLGELDALLSADAVVVSSMVVAKKVRATPTTAGDGRRMASVFETVLNIMCIRNMNSISMSTSLSELGMDSLMTIEIKQALEREFEIFLSTQDLRAMTFLRLQQLSELSGSSVERPEGMMGLRDQRSMVFDLSGVLDEGQKSGDGGEQVMMYRLKGGLNDADTVTVWIVLPGVEGDNRPAWRTIAESIKDAMYIVRYPVSAEGQSVIELAQMYAKEIYAKFPDQRHFSLIGYSFGTLIAIEIARLLETDANQTGHIICVDGSPTFLRKLILNFMASTVDDDNDMHDELAVAALQNRIGTALTHIFVPDVSLREVSERIEALRSWSEKLDTVVEYARAARGQFDDTFVRQFATGLCGRVVATMRYTKMTTGDEPMAKIGSRITLVRATDSEAGEIDELYDLGRYTTGRLDLKFVTGNHQSIVENASLADVINELVA